MDQINIQPHRIVRLCLLAGEIMLKSGAETHRVEDTVNRIASSFGIPHSQSYVTPTGIIFSLNQLEQAKLIRVKERSTDLNKVAIVNGISRRISSGELTVEQAIVELKKVANA